MPADRLLVWFHIITAGDTELFSAIETSSLGIVCSYRKLAYFFLNVKSQCFKEVENKYIASLNSNLEFLRSDICI